ncbi:hypothetical protein H3S87_00540 [Bifidobacterium sp. W8108]|uniref:hypothetical protein n=1 Tax=unclassified Bifidobacterium TaxID=2608897 RepID=UPI0018DB5BC0|nr:MULTISPECIES: hypothetical protein [unclassified Bifidobacterium]MBH9978170.1 hypothetical protein [Bifidobacterium sp. W8108]MBI0173960.1 hypothetical protein [Bifidobacterium sp. M0307]
MPIDPTAGSTLLVTAHPGSHACQLADMGAAPDRTIDPDTPAGRLVAIMAGREDALLSDQGAMATVVPLPAGKPAAAGGGSHLPVRQETDTTPIQVQSLPDTLEIPALLRREDLLDRISERATDYIRNGDGKKKRRSGRAHAGTKERKTQPCATATEQ